MKINSREELLSEIAQALQWQFRETNAYYCIDITKQEVFLVTEDDCGASEEELPADDDEVFVIEPLETWEKVDLMKDFASEQSKDNANQLLEALQWRHFFGRFKEVANELGILDDWYKYEEARFNQLAEQWLKDEGIDFIDGKITASRHGAIYEATSNDWNEEDEG